MTLAEPLDRPPLRAMETTPNACAENSTHFALGVLNYGLIDADWAGSIPAEILHGEHLRTQIWRGGPHIQAGSTGAVRWRHDGHWLFGAIDLDENLHDEGLAALTQRAYRDLFQTLAQTGQPHLLRLWNYIPHINTEQGGLERYRQFNQGRQQAFLDAGQPVFQGAPAACALGTRQGPVSIRFLAGSTAPVPIENPRQISAYHYPSAYGPRTPTFSRAALADVGGGMWALLISGTASIVGHASVHLDDAEAQTHEILRNLQALIERANQRGSAHFDLHELEAVVYLRHRADLGPVQRVLQDTLGHNARTVKHALILEADICRSELLVEIEAHAFAPQQPHPPADTR